VFVWTIFAAAAAAAILVHLEATGSTKYGIVSMTFAAAAAAAADDSIISVTVSVSVTVTAPIPVFVFYRVFCINGVVVVFSALQSIVLEPKEQGPETQSGENNQRFHKDFLPITTEPSTFGSRGKQCRPSTVAGDGIRILIRIRIRFGISCTGGKFFFAFAACIDMAVEVDVDVDVAGILLLPLPPPSLHRDDAFGAGEGGATPWRWRRRMHACIHSTLRRESISTID
jgi:hypothetical protein